MQDVQGGAYRIMTCTFGHAKYKKGDCTKEGKFDVMSVYDNGNERNEEVCQEHALEILDRYMKGKITSTWMTNVRQIPTYSYNNKFEDDYMHTSVAVDLKKFLVYVDNNQYQCMFCAHEKKRYVSFPSNIIKHIKLKHADTIHVLLDYNVKGVKV